MMNNAWKINDGDKSYTKGWGNDSASPAKPVAQHYKSSVFAGNERPATQSKGRDLTGSTDVNELINEVRDSRPEVQEPSSDSRDNSKSWMTIIQNLST
jgi:hypothetical protein